MPTNLSTILGSTFSGSTGPEGAQGSQGIQGGLSAQGNQGLQGLQGPAGAAAGFLYNFSSSTLAADPGSGFFRFNSTVTGSITEMYISDLDNGGIDRSGAILFLDDTPGPDRAKIYLPGPATGFQVSLTVTGAITDNGTWLTIPVSFNSGALPSNGEQRSFLGVRNGIQGLQGLQGLQGNTGNRTEIDSTNTTTGTTYYPVFTSGNGVQTARVRTTATAFQFDAANGNLTIGGNILNSGGRFLFQASSIQVLTSGTTYTPPSNLRYAVVIATGGGGGGGGADGGDNASGSGGGGGGAGSSAIRVYTAAQIGATASYSIGGAGSAGSGTGGTNGTAGGNTTFTPSGGGTALTANGGALGSGGGAPASGAVGLGGVGGTASGGEMNIGGGDGGSGAGQDGSEIALGGIGGSSFWGGGGRPGASFDVNSTAGTNASTYGGGGGGAACIDTTTGAAGGTGFQGVIFVLEFTA